MFQNPGGLLILMYPAPRQQLQPQIRLADETTHEVIGRLSQKLDGAIVLHQPSGIENGDAGGQLERLVHIVSDEDDGLAGLLMDSQHLVLQHVPGQRVDGAERLIHQQHFRIRRQRPSNADPLGLTTGELVRVLVAKLAGIQVKQIQKLIDPCRSAGFVPLEKTRYHGDVFRHGPVREQSRRLDGVADAPAQLFRGQLHDIFLSQENAPLGQGNQPVDHAQRSGFAAAGRANQHAELAAFDAQRDILDHILAGIGLGQSL